MVGRGEKTLLATAGRLAGLMGIAIGESAQTVLLVRKRIPAKYSTGTSALVLHVTVLSALLASLAILAWRPSFLPVEDVEIPWSLAIVIAPTVIVGGSRPCWAWRREGLA